MAKDIEMEDEINQAKIEEVRLASKKYEEVDAEIKEIKSKEELSAAIEKLK